MRVVPSNVSVTPINDATVELPVRSHTTVTFVRMDAVAPSAEAMKNTPVSVPLEYSVRPVTTVL